MSNGALNVAAGWGFGNTVIAPLAGVVAAVLGVWAVREARQGRTALAVLMGAGVASTFTDSAVRLLSGLTFTPSEEHPALYRAFGIDTLQLRASQINGCGFCVDVHTKDAAAAGETSARLNLVAAWRHSTVFTEAERAALALAEEGTRIIDGYEGVSDETWAQVRRHYDDDQVIALVSLIAVINATNRLGVILNNRGGDYESGNLATLAV
ncbi:carboxymuconolactone decarboxylase family protein [Streptomyces purpureus]|uniref:Carboxymuconolactone decarboxylase-like domain-containing protein n=1 Tax=Streptomyces purpureus TaxID=1951 RepID=A0A918HEA7_9ACTN|nr:carboxymuconolactone decarboxylase family protein [Streptomyces purpureus]GGT58001.1 hypothetical protein GCM10014713_59500 [Streptomyces purpureus]